VNAFLWAVGAYLGVGAINQETQKNKAFELSKKLSMSLVGTGKGNINLGAAGVNNPAATFTRSVVNDPSVTTNVDVVPGPKIEKLNLDITPWPIADQQYDVAFASHILEHLANWQSAFDEMRRIATYVVIVLPYPYSFGWWATKEHKQHFTLEDINKMRQIPNVYVFC
jgi:ubiquinone/menaquinone biosynthesis C-methylase UbiE